MDNIGTTTVCTEYGGFHISDASVIFPVGVAMRTLAVECYESAFSLLYIGEKG